MTRLRILMIIPNLGYGGAQRVFQDLSLALSDEYEVFQCVFNLNDQHVYHNNNELITLNVLGGNHIITKACNFLKRIVRLRSIKKKYKIDISISHLEGADYINLLSRIGREKIILCIHGSKKYDRAISGLLGWLRKSIFIPLLYRKADAIVTVAKGIKHELAQDFHLPGNILHTINNGFDIEAIRLMADQSVSDMPVMFSKPTLVTHGRLAIEKNQQLLLRIAASPELHSKIHVIIIGDGKENEPLVTLAKTLRLSTFVMGVDSSPINEHQIFFMGYQSNPFAFLKRSTLFIFPSLFEGFPLALVEAMICGVPAIASDCPYGPSEILIRQDGDDEDDEDINWAQYGVLINKDASLESWITSVTSLLSDQSMLEEYKLKLEDRVNNFSMNNFKSNWSLLISKILYER